jgi:hypothetical protein
VAATGQLIFHQGLQEVCVGEMVVDGLLVAGGQGLGHAGEAKVVELAV